MIWWLVGMLLVLAFASGLIRGRAALGPAKRARALPEGPSSPLAQRMRDLDVAIDGVREALEVLTVPAALACAVTALARHSTSTPSTAIVSYGATQHETGPGTAAFERLLARIAEIDDADRRELADAGLDPAKIIATLSSPVAPELWERELTSTLDYIQQGLRHLRTRRYG